MLDRGKEFPRQVPDNQLPSASAVASVSAEQKVPARHLLRRVWQATARIEADVSGIRRFYRRARFLTKTLPLRNQFADIFSAPAGGSLQRLIQHRPETIGAAIWPFQTTSWDGPARLSRIAEHCAVVDRIGFPLTFGVDEKLLILDLREISPGVQMILDQPPWFMREGLLTISIFVERFRAFSLAFSIYENDEGRYAIIGAVQGRSSSDVLDLYRQLTKQFHGLRPRDLLIEIFRMFCAEVGVERILAVSDDSRIHRSSFFGPSKAASILGDFNEIWTDRGGSRENAAFFLLPLTPQLRPLDQIPSKKRSMYRQRYEMLDLLREKLRTNLSNASAVRFDES